MAKKTTYDAESITILEGLEASGKDRECILEASVPRGLTTWCTKL